MPRCRRFSDAGYVYHVLNRSAKQVRLFKTASDYAAFESLMAEARHRLKMRVIAYCAMPTHWHLLLWPVHDGDLSAYVQWLATTHAARWQRDRASVGSGAVYQGRFKSIPVERGRHFYWVWRYIERNPLRANLVARAEDWRWSSLWWRVHAAAGPFDEGPEPAPTGWEELVNLPQTEAELAAFRRAVATNSAYGSESWCREMG